MKKKRFFFSLLLYSGGAHKIHVSTRQSLVRDWHGASQTRSTWEEISAWKVARVRKASELFHRNMERRMRKHSSECCAQRCRECGGKIVQCLIVPLLSIRFINKPSGTLWKCLWKHVRLDVVMRCLITSAFRTVLSSSVRRIDSFSTLTLSQKVAFVLLNFVNNFTFVCSARIHQRKLSMRARLICTDCKLMLIFPN